MGNFVMPDELRASHWNWGATIFDQLAPQPGDGPGLNMRGSVDKMKLAATLRGNSTLKYLVLWTGYTTQQLLDAITTIKSLERLEIGHLRAADISGFANLKNLEYLSVPSLSSASTLRPLTKLTNLISLSLGISGKIATLDDFSDNSMHSLRALSLGESAEKVVPVESLKPLAALRSLEYVALGRIRPEDNTLAGFLELPRLRALEVDKNARFPRDDIQALESKGVTVAEF